MCRHPFLAITLAVAAVALALGPALASAQTADVAFVREAATDSFAEIELGRLATQRAASDAVKRFAQRIVADHTLANQDLAPIAASKGVDMPRELDIQHRAIRDRLVTLSGQEFDRSFMAEMVRDHTKAVSLFQQEAQTGGDPAVRAYAQRQLPILQEHLRLAQDIHARAAAAPATGGAALPAAAIGVRTSPACAGAWTPAAGTNFGVCAR